MSDWVEITGHLPRHEVAAHLRAADVFIAPASLESFGIAALEAHAAGLIVIGRNGTGLIDYVQDGHDGRLVDGDREMVDAIVDVVRSDAKDTARRIDRPAMEQFTWAQVTQRAEELYELARLKVEQPAAAPAEVA
jgi:glycosyltransferase involved in cell wall biosynthesis